MQDQVISENEWIEICSWGSLGSDADAHRIRVTDSIIEYRRASHFVDSKAVREAQAVIQQAIDSVTKTEGLLARLRQPPVFLEKPAQDRLTEFLTVAGPLRDVLAEQRDQLSEVKLEFAGPFHPLHELMHDLLAVYATANGVAPPTSRGNVSRRPKWEEFVACVVRLASFGGVGLNEYDRQLNRVLVEYANRRKEDPAAWQLRNKLK